MSDPAPMDIDNIGIIGLSVSADEGMVRIDELRTAVKFDIERASELFD